jgi:hypothetical protein
MKKKTAKKPKSILVVKTDVTKSFVPLETDALAQLQAIVGGDWAIAEIRGVNHVVIFCNADGLATGLQINHYASGKTYRMMVGDVAIAPAQSSTK